jgi:hypothetical protein
LPDGLLLNQKSQFGKIFQGLRLENDDIFYGHLEYFADIWVILLTFGTICARLVIFPVLVSCTMNDLATLVSALKNCTQHQKNIAQVVKLRPVRSHWLQRKERAPIGFSS